MFISMEKFGFLDNEISNIVERTESGYAQFRKQIKQTIESAIQPMGENKCIATASDRFESHTARPEIRIASSTSEINIATASDVADCSANHLSSAKTESQP